MGKFTTLSNSQIKKIISEYPQLTQKGFKAYALSMGTVNTYYRILFPNKKKYYLKIDEVGDLKRLKNEINIFLFLEANKNKLNFTFPSPLRTKSGSFYTKYGNKPALFFTEVAGKSILTDLKSQQLKLVGMRMAKLHCLRPNKKIKNHRFDLTGLKKTFSRIKMALQKKRPTLAAFISEKLEYLDKNSPVQFKPSLIHADLFPDNIHWQRGKLEGIIDFEAAGLGHPLFDICVAFHALCHNGKNFDSKRIKSFMLGYESIKKIDKKYLMYFMKLSALRFLITRLKDFDLQDLSPKMKDFRNYKDYLARFEKMHDHILVS